MDNYFFVDFGFLILYAVFKVAFCYLGQCEFRNLSMFVIFYGVDTFIETFC